MKACLKLIGWYEAGPVLCWEEMFPLCPGLGFLSPVPEKKPRWREDEAKQGSSKQL